MSFGLNQSSLEALPPHERNRVCKQIRQQQIEHYVQFTSEEKHMSRPRRPNKKNTTVKFGINHLLQTAIETYDDKEVLNLLSQGADINFRTANNTSLLHKCCMVGNARATEILIGRGADVNVMDSDWWTPLHVACYHDYTDVVVLLLSKGADIMLLDIDGNFAFDHVTPDFDTYDVITEHQSKQGLNKTTQANIRRARCEILLKAVQESLNNGEDVNKRFPGGITWLHMASSNGYKGVVKLLVNNNADVNAVDDIGWTPLHVAAKYSQVKTVGMLLKNGADSSKTDHQGRKPVELAGTEEIHKVILNEGQGKKKAPIPTPDKSEKTQDSDDELEPKNSVVSKIHPARMSLSKTDKLMESQMRLAAESTSRTKHHGILEDGDEEEPIYVSAIWKVADSEKADLPDTCDNDDLTTFPDLSEKNIVDTLRKRYAEKLIYTYIGDILIAVNPFLQLPYYAKSISKQYHECIHLHTLTPHVYAIAEQAHRHLMISQGSQCCMISGESGSGKTESCKFLVQHLLRVSGSTESGLSSKINQVNPLLEAFGNARTVMNDNSSRFAKFLEVSYTNDGQVIGAELSEYLLEKSRIVHQGRGERNFHIFYWMLSGITPEETSSCLFDKDLSFRYLEPDGREIKHKLQSDDKQKFWDVKNCLDFVGFATEDVTGLTTSLAAILHLGNIRFIPIMDGQGCDVENYDVLHKVCKLLRVEFEELRLSLVEESMIARGEELRRPLSVSQAADSRDALAKTLYSRLFSWLVNGINNTIQPVEQSESSLNVAILDIFGFENLKYNGFEQICINLANEQLQMFFNERVFQQEKQDCLVEGVPIVDVSFPSNHNAISLFLEKNTGILALLDEESMLLMSTDRTLATKLHQGPGMNYPSVYKTPRDKGPSFTIVHYAGSIGYDLVGMLDKNRDTLRPSLSFVMRSSNSLLIKDLFQASMDKTGSLQPSVRQLNLQREISFRRSLKNIKPMDFFKKMKNPKLPPERKREMLTATGTTRKGPSTMAYQFRNSLNVMMSKLQKCQPHFIRCIKPNDTQTPLGFIPDYVKAQLLYTGVLETVKIRKHGYALRITFTGFLFRYRSLDLMINTLSKGMSSPEQACLDILHHFDITGYQIGKTKMFLHQGHVDLLDEKVMEIRVKVIRCQSTIRGFNARRTKRRLSSLHDGEEQQVAMFLIGVEAKQNQLSDWLNEGVQHDSQNVTSRLQKEASKSLEALDEMLNFYEHIEESNVTTLELENTLYESTTDDVFVTCPSGRDSSHYNDIPNRTDDSGWEEGDDESYQDATSLPGATLALRKLPPPPEEDMDPSRHFPPSPRDMYQYGGLYATITENGHKVDKRHPPSVPQRAPDTKLSTFSPRSSSASSGIYNEPDVYDGGSHGQWQTTSPSSPGSHVSHGSPNHWQTTSPSSPRLKSKLVHGQQPGSPRHQENQPFSYGLNFSSPKQGQGQCNGNYQNGQRARSGSTGSSHSNENPYARWIHIDQEETDLPPYPADGQPTYHHVQCVPNSPVYNAHQSPTAYGVPSSPHSPGVARPTPCPPPVPPPNPCQVTPPHVSSQIQQLKNNAIGSPKQQPKSPGSPKMSSKLHSLRVGPQLPDLQLRMDHPVPPPPNFPAPPPPVSPQARYQAVVQSNTQGRSPSPPPPPPPPEGTHTKGVSPVPPPPPPISTIPNAKAARTKEKEFASPRQNVSVPPSQNGGEAQATQLAAEIGNIKLKRVNSPQATVAPIQSAVDSGSNGQLNFRLRPTPGAVNIYKEGRDDTTKDIDELPPPPPPPPIEMELEPEPEPRPVAVVTAQPHEPKKISPTNKGKTKERSPLPYNMDLEIPDDIDINNVPGVIPVTKDTPNWKREMQEKKNREKIEEYVRKVLREREEQAKWRDVPEWKRKILMKKSQEDQEAALSEMKPEETKAGKKAPPIERPTSADCGVPKTNANITSAAMAMDPAELESMPPWKRELLFKREKVPMTFFNEFNPEDEAEAPPS